MKKKFIAIILISLLIIIAGIISIRFLTGEDTWICENGRWVKHGHPSLPMPDEPCGNYNTEFKAELISFKLAPLFAEEKIEVKFNKDVDESTLNSSNIKLWAVGISIGTAGEGEKEDISASINYNYDSKNRTLNITGEHIIGGCVACIYELELTDKVKDVEGNSLVPVTFKQDFNNKEAETEKANIVVTSPKINEKVPFPFKVSGEARVFENTVLIKLKGKDGDVLYEAFTTAQSLDIGLFGPFEKEINFLTKKPKTKDVILEVYWASPKDGSPTDLTAIPLELNLGEISEIKLFYNNNNLDPEVSCNKVFPVERIVSKTQGPARKAVDLLLEGPIWAERDQGFITNINYEVKVNGLNIKDRTAKIDFSKNLEEGVGGSCKVSAIRAQITETLKQFENINNVIISVEGRTEDILQP